LILADTKYEFGVTVDGEILLIDEIHTPDSSRYWLADSYSERLAAGQEPNMIDKEFFRLWFRDRCDPYKDAVLPVPPDELIAELAARYIQLFEKITGITFAPDLRPLEAPFSRAWSNERDSSHRRLRAREHAIALALPGRLSSPSCFVSAMLSTQALPPSVWNMASDASPIQQR